MMYKKFIGLHITSDDATYHLLIDNCIEERIGINPLNT